ncbi:MAG: glycosyltransferase family 2 protein [Acidobacteriota bacterium]|nr:glycosyltransferase family 2 protein [Blastocatellia bacterium]MDW8413353.1 glycosyltransferase family 2 protein [Acidobacteriota bacterium]
MVRRLEPYLKLSIVIPVYNEEENLQNLQKQLQESLAIVAADYEIIYIDDGSTDKSYDVLAKLAADDTRVKVIRFRRNYGQTAAMAAGIDFASGQIIVPLDADLQNDPKDIPLLVAKIEEGYDIVSGWRKNRQDDLTKTLPSKVANKLISLVTGVRLNDYGCSLKAYRSDLIKQVRLYGEMHRFIPALAVLEGAKIAEVPVAHHPRIAGKSKYGLSRTFKVFLDLITVKFLLGYLRKPMYFFGFVATFASLCSLAVIVLTIVDIGFSLGYIQLVIGLIFAVIFFFLAIMFVMMGLLAELLVRTYHESQGKKVYTIAKTINLVG